MVIANSGAEAIGPERVWSVEVLAAMSWLLHAKEANRFREAADATEQLQRLGVTVRFRRRSRKGIDYDR